MKSAVDEVLIANRWLEPLQASLAYRNKKQYLYYYRPNQELTAGGGEKAPEQKDQHYDPTFEDSNNKDLVLNSEDEPEDEPEEEPKEEQGKEEEEEENSEDARHSPTHVNAAKVSTQTKSNMSSNLELAIKAKEQKIIVIKKEEADKIIIKFPKLKSTKDEQFVGWKWTKETQPIMINSRVPGLNTQWRAPYKKALEGN